MLCALLEPHFEPSSFAYQPGRSVKQAVERVSMLRRQGYGFVVDGDIRSFFDEVPHAPLLAKLGGLWLESFSSTGRGLAQGSPVSPVLSNLYLDALDESFGEGRCESSASPMISCCWRRQPWERIARWRESRSCSPPRASPSIPKKTRILPLDTAFSFLGHLFVRSMAIDQTGDGEPGEMRFAASNISAGAPRAGLTAVLRPIEPAASPPSPATIALKAPHVEPSNADLLQPLVGDRDGDDLAVGLATLYVLARGRRLSVEHETFVVSENGRRLLAIPAHLVGRIDLGPEVEADDMALRLAGAHGIPAAFLDGLGQPKAVLTPPISPTTARFIWHKPVPLSTGRARC